MRFPLLLLVLAGLFATSLRGQTWPPRTKYVFHVYVDPTFGDDARALDLLNNFGTNPSWAGAGFLLPLTRHPDLSAIPASDITADPFLGQFIGGVINHAPYSFRTVNAAIQYLCTKGPTGNGG